MAAVLACHVHTGGASVGKHRLVFYFMHGHRWLKLICRLQRFLGSFCSSGRFIAASFEALESALAKILTLKVALSLTLTTL